MLHTWLDRLTLLALVTAIVLVSWSTAQSHLLQERLRRLESHREALNTYERTREQWEAEKAAERADREARARWRAEVMERLDEMSRCCGGSDS